MAEGNAPDYLVTAKVNGDKKRWTTIGAAWNSVSNRGNEYLSVRLNSLPMAWDGMLALHPAKDAHDADGVVPAE